MAEVLDRKQRRRLVLSGLLRALIAFVGLTILYFVLPFEEMSKAPDWVSLLVGLIMFAAITAFELWRVTVARYPEIRAIEALAVAIPFFIYVFASVYFVIAKSDPSYFTETPLSRVDTLYFTITVFATVGFGDITATSDLTRMMVSVQMVLDLVILGAIIRVFTSAVQVARKKQGDNAEDVPVAEELVGDTEAPADEDTTG